MAPTSRRALPQSHAGASVRWSGGTRIDATDLLRSAAGWDAGRRDFREGPADLSAWSHCPGVHGPHAQWTPGPATEVPAEVAVAVRPRRATSASIRVAADHLRPALGRQGLVDADPGAAGETVDVVV